MTLVDEYYVFKKNWLSGRL